LFHTCIIGFSRGFFVGFSWDTAKDSRNFFSTSLLKNQTCFWKSECFFAALCVALVQGRRLGRLVDGKKKSIEKAPWLVSAPPREGKITFIANKYQFLLPLLVQFLPENVTDSGKCLSIPSFSLEMEQATVLVV